MYKVLDILCYKKYRRQEVFSLAMTHVNDLRFIRIGKSLWFYGQGFLKELCFQTKFEKYFATANNSRLYFGVEKVG